MNLKTDPNERRILQFPAVRPCESISPPILISSLITLCHNISKFQSKTFPTQKKITRETFRQVGILLIFFEEIRENCPKLSNTLILCLSELHFTLQKIYFLLQDFDRDGSSLFILMKSNFIMNQFRVLVRSIGSSLDIVQLNTLERTSAEVKESVALLAKQASKTKLETDPNDEWAMERVMFMMRQFENRLEPERGSIKWVLDLLGIKNWVDCHKEVIFLEDEINHAEENERETSLLSSLLGFMCYCRGVIFDKLYAYNGLTLIHNELEQRMLRCLNPEDFRCPISLELMVDPVTISTGQTYDRVSIKKWLNSGHLICPKTGERLMTTEVVPNSVLKKLINKFCAENGVSISNQEKKILDLIKKPVSPSLAGQEAIKFMAQFLAGRLSYGNDEHKNKAAYEIRLLAKKSMYNRSVMIEYGNVGPLLDLLTSVESDTQENAIAAILKLVKDPKGRKAIIEEGGLMLVIFALKNGLKTETKQIAAATVFYLASVDNYRKLIGSTREAIPGLLELIKDGTITGKRNAMHAIFGLLVYHGNHERAIEAGIIDELINLISFIQRSDLLSDALSILDSLAEKLDGSIALLRTRALNLIIELVKSSISQSGKQYCVSILLSLCRNSGTQVLAVLAKEPSLMPCLYAVVVDGSCIGSKKARMLISMLQEFHESSSSSLTSNSAIRKKTYTIY